MLGNQPQVLPLLDLPGRQPGNALRSKLTWKDLLPSCFPLTVPTRRRARGKPPLDDADALVIDPDGGRAGRTRYIHIGCSLTAAGDGAIRNQALLVRSMERPGSPLSAASFCSLPHEPGAKSSTWTDLVRNFTTSRSSRCRWRTSRSSASRSLPTWRQRSARRWSAATMPRRARSCARRCATGQARREIGQDVARELRRLWDEGRASGPAESLDMEAIKREARRRLRAEGDGPGPWRASSARRWRPRT